MVKEIKYNRIVSKMHNLFNSFDRRYDAHDRLRYYYNGRCVISVCFITNIITLDNWLKNKYDGVDIFYEVQKFTNTSNYKIVWNYYDKTN